ncbi:hypothetical protein ACSSS7_001553 [Eimeria intestinalis]
MQPPAQAGVPPPYRGPQDMTAGGVSGRGPGGPSQRPMQQRPGGPPGMAGQMSTQQRPGPPGGQMGAPPPGQSSGRPMGGMPGLSGPPGGQQGPRPGMGAPGMGPRGPPGRPMGGPSGPPGGPMGGAPPGGPMGGPMGGPPRGPMGTPGGGPMGGPPGQMGGGPPGGQMGGGPPGGPMGGPGGMRFGGPPGGRPPMQGPPGGAGGMPMRPPSGVQMGGRPMQMMRSQSGQFAGPQRPGGGGGGTGGPPDMRGPMQGPPMPGYGAAGVGQPGRPDTGSMPGAQMRQPSPPKKPAQAPAHKAVFRAARKTRGQVGGGDTDKELDEDLAAKGGLGTFKNLVVLNESGDLGSWTGFHWKGRRAAGINFSKIAHDPLLHPPPPPPRLLCLLVAAALSKASEQRFMHLEVILKLMVVADVVPQGELLRWSGYSLERKAQHGFHKLKAITFDRKGNLWALNTACELAVWNEQDEEWDVKDVPGAVRMTDLAFDERNRLWIIGPEGQLMLLSGSKWVNYGFVGCWKMIDLSFKVSKLPASPNPETKAE